MTFEFCGQTWSTDKPVFVAGHNSYNWGKKSWFLYYKDDLSGMSNEQLYQENGIACKKMWIKTIHLEYKDGHNSVKDLEFELPHGGDEQARFSSSFASHKREVAVANFLKSLKKQEEPE